MRTQTISAANLLSLLAVFLPVVVGQEEEGVVGTHSTFFDPKYYLSESLTINPQTHPGLFSFTGRWLLSPARPIRPQNPIYQSTLWPGNSVTVLVHGSEVSVKVVPKPQGWIEDYHFYVSIDGGNDVRYSIPPFNSTELDKVGRAKTFSVAIEGLARGTEDNLDDVLEPHTIRLTSVPETPLCFEGLDVQTALIKQGKEWIEEQDRRVSIEFVGEGSDAERKGGFFGNGYIEGGDPKKLLDIWQHSVQYRVGETLGVRHSHISAGTCLLTSCKDQAGLFDQYFQTSPFSLDSLNPDSDLDPHHNSHINTPYRFPELSTKPQVPIPATNFVVVDLGVLDILVHQQNPDDYAHALVLFLARLRSQAHPTAKILVMARDSEYATIFPLPYGLKSTPEVAQLREKLYTATKKAIAVLQEETAEENIYFLPLSSTASSESNAYLHAICPFLLPPPSVLSKLSLNKFGRTVAWSKAQSVCLDLGSQEYSRRFRSAAWNAALILLGLFGLWMSRSIIVGTVAAVFGRKRLGMEEVEVEGGLLNGGVKRNEDYDKSG